MIYRFKQIFLFSIFLFLCCNSIAQKCPLKEGEQKFDKKEYWSAIDLYKCAYKNLNLKQKPECVWKIAECYRLIGDYKQATIYYQKAIQAHCVESEIAKSYLSDSTQMQKDKNLIPTKKQKENNPDWDN